VLLEGCKGLLAQSDAVYKEQHLLGVAGSHQRIDHGYAGARLAGAGGHHQQEVTLLLLDALQHGPDGADLVVPSGDRGVDEFLVSGACGCGGCRRSAPDRRASGKPTTLRGGAFSRSQK
jgi:hypothetical protein